MKKWILCLTACSLLVPRLARAADEDMEEGKSSTSFDFVVNAYPASLLTDIDGKKFAVNDTKSSTLYYTPNLSAGIAMNVQDFVFDLMAGGGLMVNDQFRSLLGQVTFSASYAATESLLIGPRVGLVQFVDPEWLDNDDVEFDDASGFMAGLQMSMGDRISYSISVDLLSVEFDGKAAPGAIMSDDKLEIDGLMFQFGVTGRF
jgi:hypothetical protein